MIKIGIDEHVFGLVTDTPEDVAHRDYYVNCEDSSLQGNRLYSVRQNVVGIIIYNLNTTFFNHTLMFNDFDIHL